MPNETNSITRLAMMRAVSKLPEAMLIAPVEVIAEILERESGYTELYEALEEQLRSFVPVVCQQGRVEKCGCIECAHERARAALAKARGEVKPDPPIVQNKS
jgi:hypothetical protein